MKRFVALQLILAVSISVCLPGCELAPTNIAMKRPSSSASKADDKTDAGGNAATGQQQGQQSALDSFLTQSDGSAQVQSGRAIVRDTVAILQADVDMQVGSTLVDDPNFLGKVTAYRIAGLETASDAQLISARMEELKRALAANEAKIKELQAKQAAKTMTDAEPRLLGELMGKQEALGREYETLAAKLATLTGSSGGSTTPSASPKPTPVPDHHSTTGSGEQHKNTGTTAGTNTGTTAGSGGATDIGKSYSNDEVRKMMAEIAVKAEALVKKFNSGTPLTDGEKKELENYKRSHEELGRILAARMKEEAAKQQANNPATTAKPPEKRPEPPKVDPNKRPDAPKQDFKPEEHLKRPDAGKKPGTSAGGSNQAQPGLEDMKKRLEELHRANEGLKKQLEKQLETAKRLTEELRNKLVELGKKKDEEVRKQKEQAKNVEKGVVDNGDGTHTYTMKMETANKSVKMTHEVEKTVDDLTKQVIEENSMMTKTLPNGTTMKIGRTELHNEDGSKSSTFNSEITKNGKTKTVSWNKTVNEDGSGSATGHIKKPDGSTVTIEITKDADGTTKTTATDTKHKVKAEITKGELDKNAHAKIVDSDSGKALAEGAINDTDAVAPDAD